MNEPITERQLKNMAKVFRKSNMTFQSAAEEAGLISIPDHISELSKSEAKQFLTYFSGYLVEPKIK